MILAERPADPRHRLGRLGEQAAARELERAGYRILARRYRRRVGEVDIIALDGRVVVFVEVKTRRRDDDRHGTPGEAITPRQRRRMARAALLFLSRMRWHDRPCRFDVVEVYATDAGVSRVRHIESAFHLDRDP